MEALIVKQLFKYCFFFQLKSACGTTIYCPQVMLGDKFMANRSTSWPSTLKAECVQVRLNRSRELLYRLPHRFWRNICVVPCIVGKQKFIKNLIYVVLSADMLGKMMMRVQVLWTISTYVPTLLNREKKCSTWSNQLQPTLHCIRDGWRPTTSQKCSLAIR